jgi:hypothetical protein
MARDKQGLETFVLGAVGRQETALAALRGELVELLKQVSHSQGESLLKLGTLFDAQNQRSSALE